METMNVFKRQTEKRPVLFQSWSVTIQKPFGFQSFSPFSVK